MASKKRGSAKKAKKASSQKGKTIPPRPKKSTRKK